VRLEQLVLFGPSDNFTVEFGPRVTVLAGLSDDERAGILRTLVDAMAGQVPNASVIFSDQAGRRVFADRIGATYADTGVAAPSLIELLGSDPKVISDLVTLRAADLGLGERRDLEEVEAELVGASAVLEQVLAEQADGTARLVELDAWERELRDLDDRIDRASDDGARWAWMQLRDELDQLRADLAALDRSDEADDDHAADLRLLDAVEQLRSAGEAWTEATTGAEELAAELGPLPPVSDADLAKVAATPEDLPTDLDDRVAALDAAAADRAVAEVRFAEAQEPAPDPGDLLVYELAPVDQEALWAAHDAAVSAQAAYEHELAQREDEADPEVESAIEAAHHEVVRCQRDVERRFRPGILGASALAVGALLAGDQVSLLVGVAMLASSAALGWWLLALPRRALATAEATEAAALEHAEAESWLGLHLRRIEHVMQPSDRTALAAAMDRRATTLLDWEEISGGRDLAAVGERRAAIAAHADAIDPAAVRARVEAAAAAIEAARADEAAARAALSAGLEGYGLTADGGADLDAAQLRRVLEQRTAAGRFARRALELQLQRASATTAGAILDRLLRELGFDDGDLAGRLERAVVAVEAARTRRQAAESVRTRDEIELAIVEATERVDAGRRLSWDLTPDPTEAPADRAELLDARHELGMRLAQARRPDLGEVERRLAVANERVVALQTERAELTEGPSSVRRRLADRIARTTWIGPNEETLPLVIDDALVDVEPEELFKLLEMVVRLSSTTQIVLLSGDPTIDLWARREAAHGVVHLFESDGASIA
jgi:hypothetical protein